MAGPAFDPNGAVRFDLRSGTAADAKGGRLVLLPSAAIDALEHSHPEAIQELGNQLGRACGARVAGRLGGDNGVRAAPLEVVISHLAGELAVAGVGAVHVERWGRAMVCVVSNQSVSSEVFVGAALAAAIGTASGRVLATATLGREGPRSRYFVGAPATTERVRALVAEGKAWGDVMGVLHGGAS